MADKTLYVSDLDGTLLRNDQRLSEFTVHTINALVERGMLFSYATARSYVTASAATNALDARFPVIVYNGSFVLENRTCKQLLSNAFAERDAHEILDILLAHAVYPTVYAFIDGVEKFSYCPHLQSRGMQTFQDTRRGDIRENPIASTDALYKGEIFHFTCIDEADKLLPIYERLKDRFECIYHIDIYSGDPWLEIQPRGASKANAILRLKGILGCDKVVCFGDGKNDISMFRIADECYAVENADDELKAIATAVIGGNMHDGVAKWLLENFCM